jgi:hypothetical protein
VGYWDGILVNQFLQPSPPPSRTVHFYIIKVFSPTDAQENCFKRSFKIYVEAATTCFGAVTPSSGSALF